MWYPEKNGWTIRKEWRPWSDAEFCGVWSRSALFANYRFRISKLQSVNTKQFNTLWLDSANHKLEIFSYFSQKIGFGISCKLSP